MTDMAAVEGVVRNVNEKGLRLEGAEDWLNFSKPEYRDEPWVDPEVGDSVKLGVTGKWIKTVQLTMPRAEKPVASAQQRSGSDYRSHEQINRTNALNAAVTAMSSHINPDYDQEAYLSTIEALALRWAALIETGEPA